MIILKTIKVDKIIGSPIYLNKETGKFEVEIGEKDFEADSLNRLKLDVNESNITTWEEDDSLKFITIQ